MRLLSLFLAGSVVFGFLTSPVSAQQRNPRRQLAENFARGPKVGEKLPDIAAYDADGKPFKVSSLKGSHAVIVFGCLT